jgi:hypothetical protein
MHIAGSQASLRLVGRDCTPKRANVTEPTLTSDCQQQQAHNIANRCSSIFSRLKL